MIKSILTTVAGSALLLAPVAATAQHIITDTNPVVLYGVGHVGGFTCDLTLTVTLAEVGPHASPPNYDTITNITGVNVPAPSPQCAGIRIVGGSGEIVGLNGATDNIRIDSLLIQLGATTCDAAALGPLHATGTNLTSTTAEVEFDEPSTPCGSLATVVESDPTASTQMQ